jgi:hypothetical protein
MGGKIVVVFPPKSLYTNSMKNNKWTVEIKGIKTRHHFAPATKKIPSKKIYKRNKNWD